MKKIIILSSSVRTGRKSNRVALYFQKYINAQHWGETELIDLAELKFPVFEERLKYLKDPSESLLQFAASIKEARGIVIITPEYNGGYPASLKNAIDVLYSEWQQKPIAIVTASEGAFGGMQAITSLQFILFKMGVWTVPALFPVPNIDKTFTEEGEAIDKEATDKRAERFLSQFKWFMDRDEK